MSWAVGGEDVVGNGDELNPKQETRQSTMVMHNPRHSAYLDEEQILSSPAEPPILFAFTLSNRYLVILLLVRQRPRTVSRRLAATVNIKTARAGFGQRAGAVRAYLQSLEPPTWVLRATNARVLPQ